ncbi:hypothetical protein GCM10011297_01610 [Bacterioplanes sanyensis]|uniref:acyl-CoA thioesterase n=1 Tax=Bacterioplanes sanyensis TaxID=1249553 RepID=UPI001676CC1A|nr:thioesterase family protein [Bacterioplanes sanyensis]GGY32380.1 hypothetical protein GCM10011297_01610 [Bacterioplanes sanyensis]
MKYSWSHPPAHTLELSVGPEHIDVLGHANNCEYPKWMEAVAWSHCHALGLPFERWQQIGFAWVARHTEVEYLAPALQGDQLIAGTWIGDNDGRLSMTRHYEILRASDGKLLAQGLTRWVCINLSTQKPARMPAEFKAAFPASE